MFFAKGMNGKFLRAPKALPAQRLPGQNTEPCSLHVEPTCACRRVVRKYILMFSLSKDPRGRHNHATRQNG